MANPQIGNYRILGAIMDDSDWFLKRYSPPRDAQAFGQAVLRTIMHTAFRIRMTSFETAGDAIAQHIESGSGWSQAVRDFGEGESCSCLLGIGIFAQ